MKWNKINLRPNELCNNIQNAIQAINILCFNMNWRICSEYQWHRETQLHCSALSQTALKMNNIVRPPPAAAPQSCSPTTAGTIHCLVGDAGPRRAGKPGQPVSHISQPRPGRVVGTRRGYCQAQAAAQPNNRIWSLQKATIQIQRSKNAARCTEYINFI